MADARRGRKHTPETIAKISAANRGKVRSPEVRAKMAAARRGKTQPQSVRDKISAANRGRKPTRARAVMMVETGEHFDSMRLAAKALGVVVPTVSRAVARGEKCRGRTLVEVKRTPAE